MYSYHGIFTKSPKKHGLSLSDRKKPGVHFGRPERRGGRCCGYVVRYRHSNSCSCWTQPMTMSHRVTDSNSYLNALVMYAVLTKVPGVVSFHMSMVSMDVQDLAHFCVKSFRLYWPGCLSPSPEGGSHLLYSYVLSRIGQIFRERGHEGLYDVSNSCLTRVHKVGA